MSRALRWSLGGGLFLMCEVFLLSEGVGLKVEG